MHNVTLARSSGEEQRLQNARATEGCSRGVQVPAGPPKHTSKLPAPGITSLRASGVVPVQADYGTHFQGGGVHVTR